MAWTTFGALTNPTLPELDTNLLTLAQASSIPCVVSGAANALILTPVAGMPPVAALANYMSFTAIAGSTNSGATTVQIGALTALNAYKDTAAGPVAMVGTEIVQNCAYQFVYDSTLNSNAGGFHVNAFTAVSGSVINPSAIQIGTNAASLTRFVSATVTMAFTVVPANTTQEQTAAVTGVQVGDAIQIGYPATLTAGLMFNARVPAAGSITVRAANVTAASIAAFTLAGVHLLGTGATP